MKGRISAVLAGSAFVVALMLPTHAAVTGVTLTIPGRASANVSLASEGGFVAAVWSASLPSGETDIYAAASSDSGRTFSAPVRVNSVAGDARVNGEQPPRLALKARPGHPAEIAVVWTAKGSAGTKILSSSSLDGARSFRPSTTVPGSDAPGNRGWEAVGLGPGGDHFFSVWLDHRKLAPPQQAQMATEHHHGSGSSPMPSPAPQDGVAMAQLSQLYVTSLDAEIPPRAVTGGVCYCCKTALAAGPANSLYLAWRHVYPGNMRDIAFTVSRDGGKSFTAPVRVSEDRWQIEGCPDDGPTMVVDGQGRVHVVWPSVVTERGGPVKALFHAMSRDGKTFTSRERIPTEGQANHPQLAVDANGTLAVVWDESGTGTRRLASATGRVDSGNRVHFERGIQSQEIGTYPVVVATGGGTWVQAWTSGQPDRSIIRISRLP